MAINRKCLACNGFQGDCIGSDTGCGKWARLDLTATEAQATMPTATIKLKVETDGPPPNLLPISETRRQKFARIGCKRREQALEEIRKLEHLTSSYYGKRSGVTTYTYEWTSQQALDLLMPIEVALEALKRKLLRPASNREHGLV